jgi:serine/threonine protein kinase
MWAPMTALRMSFPSCSRARLSADELRNGPLPVRKAIDYATQIARGLAAVHEKDIFHRDLKPANVS